MSTEIKVKFDTAEELLNTYPIGYIVFSFSKQSYRNEVYYNKTDLELIYKKYGKNNVQILDECYAKCTYIDTIEKKVEGYIFDGEHWRPAYSTWDGWVPYDEDDFNRL